MVFAQGEQFDVLDNDHMVIRLLEQGALHDGFPVLEIPLGKELHGLGHALRGLEKAFTFHVLSQETQDGLDVPRNFLRGFFVVFLYFPVCHGLFFVAIR